MKTILITAIGGDIAQGVATAIRESRPEYRLIGVDIHDQHGGRIFVNTFHKIPPASDKNYLAAIKSIIDIESVEIVLPISEPELSVLVDKRDEFKHVRWLGSGEKVISAGLDKLTTMSRLEELGIPIPWTVSVNAGEPRRYPCILKSRKGSGSRCVFVVADNEEANYLVKRHPDSIYQELLLPDKQEITCAVFRASDGRIAILQMLRKLVGGFTGWARVINDPAIRDMCRTAAVGLDLIGSMNVQLRITANGPRIFEINPRFSSTTLMRHRFGFTDAIWALDDLEEKVFEIQEIAVGTIGVRMQNAAVLQHGTQGVLKRKE